MNAYHDDAYDFGGPADAGYRGDDCDPYYLDDHYGRRPCNCPRPETAEDAATHPGCRKCNPPEFDNCPYGWGIERFEDPALDIAREDANSRWLGGPYRSYNCYNYPEDCYRRRKEMRDEFWAYRSTHNAKLAAKAKKVWDGLCDKCETHHEAVERYSKWAEKTTGRKRKK